MKIMRNLTFLALFILISTQLFGQRTIMGYNFGQNSDQLIKGDRVLSTYELKETCITYTETPDGVYIGTRSSTNVPINYLYKNGKLTDATDLNRFTIFGYSHKTNSLVLTSYNSKSADIISGELYTYELSTHKFKNQSTNNKRSDIYDVAVKGDTVICLVNIKRIGQVGSDIKPKLIVLK